MMDVSVIIPARNEEKHIAECLDSLFAQDYPKDRFEIIVIDGMSTDRTRAIVGDYPGVRLLDNPNKIAPAGTNIGIKASKGEIIVRIDAHAKVEKDFISQSVKYLRQTGADCVGGPITTLGKGYLGQAISYVLSSPFGTGSKFRYSNKPGYVDTVPFGAYRKEAFDRFGLFDESIPRSEDLEFNHRIIKAGGKIFMTPDIKSYYYCRSTVGGMIRQNFLNGVDVVKAIKKDRSSISIRHLIPFFFISGLTMSLLFAFISSFGLFLFFAIFLIYSIANLFFSIGIVLKHKWKYFPVLLVLFFCLHLSYAAGTILGLFRLMLLLPELIC
ncbi:MAG: glycosyltransferase family 2 protein [Candidatus Margulisiibacteriota bacterium]